MRLPNGYGNVSKLPGKRRNPWRARKTNGWIIDPATGKAKQDFLTIGYFPTRAAALEALSNFNQNPYDISTDNITFAEVYEKWSEQHFDTITPSATRTWKSAYSYTAPIHNMRFRYIRANHIEGVIRNAAVGSATKQRMKSLFNQIYRFAIKHDITDKNHAGKNRIVPIHPAISDIITTRTAQAKSLGSEYLFNDIMSSPTNLTYDKYRRRFEKIMKHYDLKHRPHDTRHTFITLAKANGMDEYILKLIAGHVITDITEKTYTHRTIEDLHNEIIKIPDLIH